MKMIRVNNYVWVHDARGKLIECLHQIHEAARINYWLDRMAWQRRPRAGRRRPHLSPSR